MRLANLDGNARADAVVAFQGDNQVGFCMGQAAPPFYPAGSLVKLPTQQVPSAAVVADLDGDGTLDVAVANRGASTIFVYKGTGGGAFTAWGAFPTGGVEPRRLSADELLGVKAPPKAELATVASEVRRAWGEFRHLLVLPQDQRAVIRLDVMQPVNSS